MKQSFLFSYGRVYIVTTLLYQPRSFVILSYTFLFLALPFQSMIFLSNLLLYLSSFLSKSVTLRTDSCHCSLPEFITISLVLSYYLSKLFFTVLTIIHILSYPYNFTFSSSLWFQYFLA